MDERRVSRRGFLGLSALALASGGLAGCSAPATPTSQSVPSSAPVATKAPEATQPPAHTATPAPPAEVKLVMMDWSPLPDEMLGLLREKLPYVTLEWVGYDQTRLRAMWAGGSPPDFWNGGSHNIPQWVFSNWLLDLTEYFNVSQILRLDDLAWGCDYWLFDGVRLGQGKRYGIPVDWGPDFATWCNPDPFNEAGVPVPSATEPLRWADIPEIAKALTKKEGDRTLRVGTAFDTYPIEVVLMFRLADDGEHLYTTDYDKIKLKDRPQVLEVMEVFYRMWSDGSTWTPLNPSPGWAVGDFVGGTAATTLMQGSWFMGMIKNDESVPTHGKAFLAPAPFFGRNQYNCPYGPAGMAVSRITKNPDAAFRFYEWRYGEEPAIAHAKEGTALPPLKSLWQYIPKDDDWSRAVWAVIESELAHGEFMRDTNPYYQSLDGFSSALETQLTKALKGEVSLQEMLANMEKDINERISDGLARLGY